MENPVGMIMEVLTETPLEIPVEISMEMLLEMPVEMPMEMHVQKTGFRIREERKIFRRTGESLPA